MGRDRGVALVDAFLANPLDQPLDRLGPNIQLALLGQFLGGGPERLRLDSRADHLPLHPRAVARAIKSQRLVLRGKKPANSGDNSAGFPSIGHSPAYSALRGAEGELLGGLPTARAEPWPLLGTGLGLGLDLALDQLPCHLVGSLASDDFEVGKGGALGEAVGIELPSEFPGHLPQTNAQLLA
jgi:hypothetical protein